MYPWDHWRTFVPLILGFAGLALFIVWEIHFASEPLTTLNVFMNRTAAVSYINTVLHGIIVSLFLLSLSYLIVANVGRCCTTSHCTLKQSKSTAPSRPVLQSSRKHSPWPRLPWWLESLFQSPEDSGGHSG